MSPVEERVRRMVEYTGRDAVKLIGYVNPVGGGAAVEKIAVNRFANLIHPPA